MSKSHAGLAALALVGWGLFTWKLKNPTVKIETVEKEKFIDRIVNTETVRTVTKPSGTTIVTRTVSKEAESSKEKSTAATTVQAPLPQYSVGAGVGSDFSLTPIYSFEVGARLGDLPLWLTLEANSNREAFAALRLEF